MDGFIVAGKPLRAVFVAATDDRGSEEELVAMASPQSRGVAWMADPDALEAAGQTDPAQGRGPR